jgi:glycosyltransferase involved in cell wall biosynthesis
VPKTKKKLISMIVPAYKQQKTIVTDIKVLSYALSSLPMNYEIIVVVDGFLDDTFKKAKGLKINNLTVIGYEKNLGKGFAVKHGVEIAKGDIIGFIDAGMDINASTISLMLDLMEWNKADVIVGSKLHPESKVNYPLWRKILSWGYRTLTHIMFGFSVRDTQVGLKIFKKKVAKDVFSRIVVKRFAFDIEVLALAYKLGYKKIFEAPIQLDFRAGSISSTNFWKIILWMLWDTLAVYYRLNLLHYYDRNISPAKVSSR